MGPWHGAPNLGFDNFDLVWIPEFGRGRCVGPAKSRKPLLSLRGHWQKKRYKYKGFCSKEMYIKFIKIFWCLQRRNTFHESKPPPYMSWPIRSDCRFYNNVNTRLPMTSSTNHDVNTNVMVIYRPRNRNSYSTYLLQLKNIFPKLT